MVLKCKTGESDCGLTALQECLFLELDQQEQQ